MGKRERSKEEVLQSELGPSSDDILKMWSELGEEGLKEATGGEGEEEIQGSIEEEATPVPEEKTRGFEDILALLPEKFRQGDLKESLKKFVDSYRELEARLTRTSQELTEATKLLKSLASAKPVTAVESTPSAPGTDFDDIEIKVDLKPDEVYSDLPGAIQKAVSQAVAQAAKQFAVKYNPARAAGEAVQTVIAQMALAQLRSRDPKTFELVKQDLLEVLREKPYLDTLEGLEIAYEEAKQRYRQRQEELRRQLMDEEFLKSLKEGLLRELADRIGVKGRETVGIPTGSGGGNVEVQRSKPVEKSPSEILKEMIASIEPKSPLLTGDFE